MGGAGAGGAWSPPVPDERPQMRPLPYAWPPPRPVRLLEDVIATREQRLAAAMAVVAQREADIAEMQAEIHDELRSRREEYNRKEEAYVAAQAEIERVQNEVDSLRTKVLIRRGMGETDLSPTLQRYTAAIDAGEARIAELIESFPGRKSNDSAYFASVRFEPGQLAPVKLSTMDVRGVSYAIPAPPPAYFMARKDSHKGFVYTTKRKVNGQSANHAVFIVYYGLELYLFNQNDHSGRVAIDGFEMSPWTMTGIVKRPLKARFAPIECGFGGECSSLSQSFALYWNALGPAGYNQRRLNKMIEMGCGCNSVRAVRLALGLERRGDEKAPEFAVKRRALKEALDEARVLATAQEADVAEMQRKRRRPGPVGP